jgi:tetratricopeptide (TPR) repeat protein
MIAGLALSALLLIQQRAIHQLNDHARVLFEHGRLRDAQQALEQSLCLQRALQRNQPATRDLALTLNNLGVLYTKLNLLSAAETTLAQAVEIRARLGDQAGQAEALISLGSAYRAEHRYEQAAALFRQSLALSTQDRDIAVAANNLAVALEDLKRPEDAEPLLIRALSIFENGPVPDHARAASALNNLGVLYVHLDRIHDAEPRLARAVSVAEHTLPPDHPDLAAYRQNYAQVLRKLDRKKEAQKLEAAARASRQRFNRDNALGFTVDVRQSYH